jgi:hypothetical protein
MLKALIMTRIYYSRRYLLMRDEFSGAARQALAGSKKI